MWVENKIDFENYRSIIIVDSGHVFTKTDNYEQWERADLVLTPTHSRSEVWSENAPQPISYWFQARKNRNGEYQQVFQLNEADYAKLLLFAMRF